MILPKNEEQDKIPLNLNIIIKEFRDQPAIELRKIILDYPSIKKILSCAFHGQPIIVIPMFSNRHRALSSLVEKGILYRQEDGFFFTF